MKCRRTFLWAALWSIHAVASVPIDTLTRHDALLSHELDTGLVRGHRVNTPLAGSVAGTLMWDMDFMNSLPKILGNADPLHYAQLLPGIQTCNEYDSGLYIQGCDQSQNYVTISGAPLYNVQHMLGFFSIFNSPHFASMSFTTSRHSASFPNRLGGELDMDLPDSIPIRFNGELSVGVMSSQATLRVPFSSRSALFVSARAAYLNLLYGRWLRMEGTQVKYAFDDYNITYLLRPSEKDIIHLNAYYGGDNVSLIDAGYQADCLLNWGNALFSVDWHHRYRQMEVTTTWYGVIEIAPCRRQGEDVAQGLFCLVGNDVQTSGHLHQIFGIEPCHQALDLFHVLVIVRRNIHVEGLEIGHAAFRAGHLHVTEKHFQKLYGVYLHSVVLHLQMKGVTTDGKDASGFDTFAESHHSVAYAAVGHVIFPVTGRLV